MVPDYSSAPGPIIVGISDQIFSLLTRLAQEEYYPQQNPDLMDDTIRGCKEKIAKLRHLREELENVMSGALL